MPIPLLALAISAFAIGTTEFVIMGLLPQVASDLAVSIPSAGLLVSGYALGVAVGAPLLAIVTSKMPRKLALQMLMGVFIVGNVLCAIASDYSVLMIARVVTSFAHGSFFGIGAVVASSLVPQEKRASAIALDVHRTHAGQCARRAVGDIHRSGVRLAHGVLGRERAGRVVARGRVGVGAEPS